MDNDPIVAHVNEVVGGVVSLHLHFNVIFLFLFKNVF